MYEQFIGIMFNVFSVDEMSYAAHVQHAAILTEESETA